MKSTASSILTPDELLEYIEYLRKDLINLGIIYGFNNIKTIQASQELDFFIFEYQKNTNYSSSA